MSEDDRYLWDGSGTPDPEIERLERALEPLRAPVVGPALPLAAHPRRWVIRAALASAGTLAAAASVALVVRGRARQAEQPELQQSPPLLNAETPGETATPFWPLKLVAGHARIGERPVAAQGRIHVGQVLETEADGQAQLEVPALGTVEVQAYTRVELVAAGDHQQRLRLHQGALEVSIFAPPGKFFVETPSGQPSISAAPIRSAWTRAATAGWR